MALPTPPPYTNPIPNNPFYAPLNAYVCGPYFPVALGNGIDLTASATVPQLVNEVRDVLAAGPGIALTTFLGVTTITSTGGGGGATPATPTATGTLFGYTDGTDVDFNTSLGYCALGVGGGSASGFANVAIGICAGCAITSAYGNTLIGPGTGIAIDTGNTNTALGIGSLSLTTSGFANVGVGMCSGCAYTTESGNAVFGGHPGDAGDTNVLILADGPGNLKAKFDSLGALSFDGTNYGAIGEVLSSNGAGAKPTWIAGGGASPATPDTFGTVVGLVDTNANAGLGCFVLYSLTTGTDNVAIGDNALVANTSGGYNVAVGTYAASYNTTGAYNTAVGHNVFNSNTSGSYNNAFGLGTLGANITGCYNNAFGWGALGVSLSGDSNTAIGNKAMALNNTGSFNMGIGEYSLCSIDSGCYNVGVGHCSGKNISTGCYNVAIGPEVEFASGASSCQLSIGFSATENWLTGNSTKAIKPGAGVIDCAGSCGTVGQVLMSNGANAICWGSASGASAATPIAAGVVFACTLAASHTFLGNCAGTGGGGTSSNTGIGTNSLKALTGGQFTVALGFESMAVTTATGSRNIAVGYRAANSTATNVGTSDNIFVGANSGTLLGGGASGNISIGSNSANTFATGSCNIVVGTSGAQALTSGSNNVAIGAGVQLASATGSCQLAIGFSPVENWLTGTSTKAIKPGAGVIDCANSCGTAGQVLISTGANAICWGALPAATPTVSGTVVGWAPDTGVNCNTALGYFAFNARGGVQNTALGVLSMYLTTSGSNNTAVGYQSSAQVSSGNCNISVGMCALSCVTTGSNNIGIGYSSGSTLTGLVNLTTENNRIVMGNGSHTCAQIQIPWTTVSDARDKAIDPAGVPYGLSFVNQIQPIAYCWCDRTTGVVTEDRKRFGFSAQDICSLETATSTPVIVSADDPEHLMITDQALLPVLVKAIQELSAKVEALEAKLAANG